MSRFAVDASVVVKWYFDEVLSSEARLLLAVTHELTAPDLLILESANVFLKKIRAGAMRDEVVPRALDDIVRKVDVLPSTELRQAAFSLALRYNQTSYDGVYVALALREDCQLVTADERLFNSLHTPFPNTMLWLGDIPTTV